MDTFEMKQTSAQGLCMNVCMKWTTTCEKKETNIKSQLD